MENVYALCGLYDDFSDTGIYIESVHHTADGARAAYDDIDTPNKQRYGWATDDVIDYDEHDTFTRGYVVVRFPVRP